jgi:hypothetical protein
LEDAVRYGGDLTHQALSTMKIRGDRKFIIVDTKVHMLMPGFMPAIPGWHTDGAPRSPNRGAPNLFEQEKIRSPRFHLFVTGDGCLTQFIKGPIELDVPEILTTELYALLTKQIGDRFERITIPSCRTVEFDWWDLHTGVPATKHEWRFLMRVYESDLVAPLKDLRDVIRNQQQVYVPMEFGW